MGLVVSDLSLPTAASSPRLLEPQFVFVVGPLFLAAPIVQKLPEHGARRRRVGAYNGFNVILRRREGRNCIEEHAELFNRQLNRVMICEEVV